MPELQNKGSCVLKSLPGEEAITDQEQELWTSFE